MGWVGPAGLPTDSLQFKNTEGDKHEAHHQLTSPTFLRLVSEPNGQHFRENIFLAAFSVWIPFLTPGFGLDALKLYGKIL
jgi:hypothetical protein